MQITLDTLKVLRADGSGVTSAMPPSRPNETAVQHDTFFGMTIADAAKKYLNMMKATRSTSDEALPVVIRTPQEYRRLLRATKALAELLHVPPELFI